MKHGDNTSTTSHRERGRGRKAFWIIVGALVVAGSIYLP
jgi:hypothetical protein